MVQLQSEDKNMHLKVVFFRTQRGNEPAREWLKTPLDDLQLARERLKQG
jgi:hypothetical protein